MLLSIPSAINPLVNESSGSGSLMNNSSASSNGGPPGSPAPSNMPNLALNSFGSPGSNADSNSKKRPSHEVDFAGFGGTNDRPTKRQFNGMTAMPMDEKFGQQQQHHLPLRHTLMGGSSLMGNPTQGQSLADYQYQNNLFAASLVNRHAELAQRQLLSRYLPAQLQLNQLATSLAGAPSMGLGSLAGHRPSMGSSNNASSAGQNHNLTALFSRSQSTGDRNQMPSRFQQQPAALTPAIAFQSLTGGHPHQERLQIQQLQENGPIVPSMMSSMSRSPLQAGMLPNISKDSVRNNSTSTAMGSFRSTSLGSSLSSGGNEHNPIPLGIDEDPNWLSDFHVFVRANLVELCWASSEDVALRNASNRVSSHQVGIRCRCCAHLNPSARAQRSSAFPSSVAQIYQSFTMMLRAHFSSCAEVPPAVKEKFLALKSKTTQGATDSKQYWIYSARKLGMVDSEEGIVMTKATTAAARAIAPFGSENTSEESSPLPLVAPNDRTLASDFLYTLMLQGRRVRLQANEQRGNKKSLQLGLPGFACRHCCQLGRMGQCRIFPARRRTLPTKIYDLFEHLQRCSACPKETKELLEALHERENYQANVPGQKEFLDLIWSRLVEQQNA